MYLLTFSFLIYIHALALGKWDWSILSFQKEDHRRKSSVLKQSLEAVRGDQWLEKTKDLFSTFSREHGLLMIRSRPHSEPWDRGYAQGRMLISSAWKLARLLGFVTAMVVCCETSQHCWQVQLICCTGRSSLLRNVLSIYLVLPTSSVVLVL